MITSANSLHNPYQSAYTRYHSTETTLLSLHNHLVTAIRHQQVSCLCLLDLSTAFYTKSILLHRLSSWFGITDIALALFQSYLLSCSFCILPHLTFHLLMAYHKDPFLDQFFSKCILHPLVLSSPHGLSISTSMLTILNSITFTPKTFITAVTRLQNTITDISSWMT